MSTDGSRIAFTQVAGGKRTSVLVKSARGGKIQSRRTFSGSVHSLDLTNNRVVISTQGPGRTYSWYLRANRQRTLLRKTAYIVDLEAGHLAYYTRDPYRDGCTRVAAISKPRTHVAELCDQRVEGFSPDGEQMATIHILSDGLGRLQAQVRDVGGGLLTIYNPPRYLGKISWESSSALLLETYGPKKMVTARCVATECEAATDLRNAANPQTNG